MAKEIYNLGEKYRMNKGSFCYTGFGSRKSGNHTQKQFLKVMDKNFSKKCSVYVKSKKCKSCKKSMDMNIKERKKHIRAQLKHEPYIMSYGTETRILKQMSKCKKCKTNNTKKCNVKNYLLFSGADKGKCEEA